MFWYRRALAVIIICIVAFPACAFTFSYGSLFDVKDVKNEDGVLQMPLTRKKYSNVKILSKDLYDFLQKCNSSCIYQADSAELQIEEIRPAKTNEQLFIADVSINEEILLTLLVFKNQKSVSVKFPEVFVFKDKKFKERIRKYVVEATEKV